jgi:type VI protein secretion system component Hcp
MRNIIFFLFFIPWFGLEQKTDVLIKLTDANGQQIKGDAMLKDFERWMGATSIVFAGKNNTELHFTMTVSAASADLKRALATGGLLSGQVSALSPDRSGAAPAVSYTIKMERVTVTSCTETMGCNGIMNTTVSLQAGRIGWSYYNPPSNGMQSIARGWDAEKNIEWVNF